MDTGGKALSRVEVENILESILKDENVINPIIKIEEGSIKGEGYLSFLTKVDVIGENKNLHLMIKVAPRSEEFRKIMPIGKLFSREIYFYNTIIKEFNQFQQDKGLKVPVIVPKCFKTSEDEGKEFLVMENVKLKGFCMWKRNNQMNEEHINMVFKQYGKYHAISYALKDQKPELYTELVKKANPVFTSEEYSIDMYNKFIENVKNIVSIFDPDVDNNIIEKINKFIEGLKDFLLSVESIKNKNSVIIHGDCWCNNMMFRYEEDDLKKPAEILLLDFQVAQIGSPMSDLCYFFLPSAPKRILYDYKHYLGIYYENLKERYQMLGGKLENLPTFNELHEEWKVFTKYGFTMALILFKAMLCSKEEALDFDDTKASNMDFMDIFCRKLENEDVFEEMVKVLVKYMCDHDFF